MTALVRDGSLSEGGYHAVASGALVALAAGAGLWTWTRARKGPRARLAGWGLGLGLAVAGAGLGLDATGAEAGLALFNLGFLLLLVTGPTLAVALRREEAAPVWLVAFLVAAGFGALLGSVLADASLPAALLGLGPWAAGWLALAVRLARGGAG